MIDTNLIDVFLKAYNLNKDELFYIYAVDQKQYIRTALINDDQDNSHILFPEEFFIDSRTNTLKALSKCGSKYEIVESAKFLNTIFRILLNLDNLNRDNNYIPRKKQDVSKEEYKSTIEYLTSDDIDELTEEFKDEFYND